MGSKELINCAASLRDDVEKLAKKIELEGSTEIVYNPLIYAWEIHEEYLRLAGDGGAKNVLLGLNPGPHGMGQMGIPFAATSVVRDLLGITGIPVGEPRRKPPSRPVNGLSHPKEEVSGTRLWGVLAERYGNAKEIFSNVFPVNYCPLMIFSGPRATNITPNNIKGTAVKELLVRCDQHLLELVEILGAHTVIGVGKFAEYRARKAMHGSEVSVKSCWHPSPASPLANRNGGADWRENISSVLP